MPSLSAWRRPRLERKVIERTEELARANEALREADRRKDEFLSTLGHELRNPLAPILNALEIIRLCGDNAEAVAQQRERLERQVKQMVRLVDDLLDVSRVSTGKLRLNAEPITLQEVCEAAIDISRPLIEKAGLHLTVTLPAAPISLEGDRVRLTQVFSNLLNNSAKYTEAGGQRHVDRTRGSRSCVVNVRDTGVGIAPEVLAAHLRVVHSGRPQLESIARRSRSRSAHRSTVCRAPFWQP